MLHASPTPRFALLLLHALRPIESLGGVFEHRPQPRILQMGEAKFERIAAANAASSSMNDSRPNVLPVEARARYEPCRSGGRELIDFERLCGIL